MEQLLARWQDAVLSHALIVESNDAAAIDRFASLLAHVLMCEGRTSHPCGVCRACRLITAETHADLFIVPPLDEPPFEYESRADPLEPENSAIRPSQNRCHSTRRAHNRNAQNALLKLLEEPTDQTLLILGTSNPQTLLPTVRSRCGLFLTNLLVPN